MDETQGTRHVSETGVSPVGAGLYLTFTGVTLLAAFSRFRQWPVQAWTDLLWLVFTLALWSFANARNLPIQNRLLAVILASGLGWAVLNALEAGSQLNPFDCYWLSPRRPLPDGLVQPLLWAVLLLHGRGVAKLRLNQRDRSPWFGIQVIALSSGLVCAFMVGPALAQDALPSTPWPHSLALLAVWFALAALCEALLTPALLKKRPGPEIHFTTSVWVWIAGNGLVVATALAAANRRVALLQSVLTIIVAWLPLRRFGTRGRALVMASPT